MQSHTTHLLAQKIYVYIYPIQQNKMAARKVSPELGTKTNRFWLASKILCQAAGPRSVPSAHPCTHTCGQVNKYLRI